MDATYADKPTAVRLEEGVAELYRIWAQRWGDSDVMGRAFAKVGSVLRAIASALPGRGLTDPAKTAVARVLERIAAAKIGDRGPDSPGGGGPHRGGTGQSEMRLDLLKTKARSMLGRETWRSPSDWVTDAMDGKRGGGTL